LKSQSHLSFLAIVSPLLVLARACGHAPYRGWRLAALVVLAFTALAWFLWPDVSGYVGGAAWFLLLFLPTIALRKNNATRCRGDYESAGKLGAAIQILASHRRTSRANPVISQFEI